jgi:hypothetical protein
MDREKNDRIPKDTQGAEVGIQGGKWVISPNGTMEKTEKLQYSALGHIGHRK